MEICDCSLSLSNTGRPDCIPLQDAVKKLMLVSLSQADGTLNEINLTSATLDQTEITALINNTDELQRWYPLGSFLNVEEARAESIKEEFEDGSKVKIEDGVKTFKGIMINATPDVVRKVKQWGCVKPAVYAIDKQGNLIGDGSVAGKLRPIPVNADTWDPIYVPATDKTVPKMELSFEWRRDFKDSDLQMILASDYASGVDLLNEDGLIDLFGEWQASPAVAATGATIDISTDYGSIYKRKGISNLDLVNDFEVVGSTSGATAIATAVENSTVKGRYAVTWSTLTGETVYIQKKTATNGWSDTNLITATQVLP